MADIVEAAIDQQRMAGKPQIAWVVFFRDDRQKSGMIENLGLGSGNYVIHQDNMPYYFSADQVIYLRPADV